MARNRLGGTPLSVRLATAAAVTLTLLGGDTAVASAGTQHLPVGRIDGTVVSATESLLITATTEGGGGGTAVYTAGGRAVSVTLDCVRTYGVVGLVLFPIVGAYGYASGIGSDGHRYYLLVNEGYGIAVNRQAGPPISVDTCGVGYVLPRIAATATAIVPQTTLAWSFVGVL